MRITIRQLGLAVVAILIGLASVITVFSGPLPEMTIRALAVFIPSLPASTLQLLVGGLLFTAGIVYFWAGRETPDRWIPLVEPPPERPQQAPQVVGETFETETEEALADIRLKDNAYDKTVPHRRLQETAETAVRITQGCSEETAAQVVARGNWTDDRIAAAFLSDELEYPVRFRLFVWARPADAFERAVERASFAVDQYVREELPAVTHPSANDQQRNSTASWFERSSEADSEHGQEAPPTGQTLAQTSIVDAGGGDQQ